jgi:hypothetical protein
VSAGVEAGDVAIEAVLTSAALLPVSLVQQAYSSAVELQL